MVPDDRKGIVGLRVIEKVIAQSAVVVCFSGWDPVNCKGGVIFAGYVGIETPVPLFEITRNRAAGGVVGDIGYGRKSAADTGVAAADIGEILLAQASGERRANVYALSRNVSTIGGCESGSHAVSRGDDRAEGGC